jgi:UDP-N-acetylmuramoylalanine--D-glutamate ligase
VPLRAAFAGRGREVVLIGRAADALGRALNGISQTHPATTLDEAVDIAARLAQPGDTVLLSPACASLDMFRDYAHRGSVFTAAVQRRSA